jgi:hypothetical protein
MREEIKREITEKRCRRGEAVLIYDEMHSLLAGGGKKEPMTRRMFNCSKAPGLEESRFQLTQHQEWMCEDCNLVT